MKFMAIFGKYMPFIAQGVMLAEELFGAKEGVKKKKFVFSLIKVGAAALQETDHPTLEILGQGIDATVEAFNQAGAFGPSTVTPMVVVPAGETK